MTAVPHSPLERLMVSRAGIRQALRTLPTPGPFSAGQAHAEFGTDALITAIRAWWVRHPLHDAATDAATSAKAVLLPIAQRNPLGLVFAALVTGGLVAWARPWRWISFSGLFAGIMPQVVAEVLAQIRPSAWGDILSALLAQTHIPKS